MIYISRDKAIAYVEEQYRLFKNDESKQAVVEGCVEALKFVPLADVAEVVRCKDCKHCEIVNDQFDNDWYFCTKTVNNAEVKATDFCSYGERRDT